jgi:hypothetical protein
MPSLEARKSAVREQLLHLSKCGAAFQQFARAGLASRPQCRVTFQKIGGKPQRLFEQIARRERRGLP